jgi:MIP family channel proteins
VLTPATGQALIGEFVGTFALIFIGAGSIVTDSLTKGKVGLVGIAAAHGLVLSVMVSAIGHVSGAHFNPAVTVAFLLARKITASLAGLYVATQLIAAVAGGLLLRAIFASEVWQPVHLGTPGLGEGTGFATGVLLEAVLTFFLVFAIFGIAVDPRGPFKGIAGFGIGLVLAFDILVGGPLTGASMNPARTFGPAVASGFWDNHLVYWFGPLLGAATAGLLYGYVLLPRASPVAADQVREREVKRSTR